MKHFARLALLAACLLAPIAARAQVVTTIWSENWDSYTTGSPFGPANSMDPPWTSNGTARVSTDFFVSSPSSFIFGAGGNNTYSWRPIGVNLTRGRLTWQNQVFNLGGGAMVINGNLGSAGSSTADQFFVSCQNGGANNCQLNVAGQAPVTFTASASVFHQFQVDFFIDTVNGAVTLKVDGTQVASITGNTNGRNAGATPYIDTIVLEGGSDGFVSAAAIDDMTIASVVLSASGDAEGLIN